MKRLSCITALLLSALLLCSALQSCRSVNKLFAYSQDIKKVSEKNHLSKLRDIMIISMDLLEL